MGKRAAGIAAASAVILGVGFIFYNQTASDESIPADHEIALQIQLDTTEDIGLLVYDYCADGHEYSGGTSNADGSLLKHDSNITVRWTREELNSSADSVAWSVQFRIITEYVTPNYENIYPDEITEYTEPVSWEAYFGETYYVTITGNKANGYNAILNEPVS